MYAFCVEIKAALILMIEPSPVESSLFLYGSMNFAELVPSLQKSTATVRGVSR